MNTNTTLNYPLASSCWSTARHALEDGTAPTAQKQPAAEGGRGATCGRVLATAKCKWRYSCHRHQLMIESATFLLMSLVDAGASFRTFK